MSSKDLGKRMTWEEIKHHYPHQYVGLIEMEKTKYSFTAIVKCTDKDLSYEEMLDMAFGNKIKMLYTTSDEDEAQIL